MDYTLTQGVQAEALETLAQWIKVPSVLDESDDQTPFGPHIQEALELALKTCEDLGFTTFIDPEGYYGYAEVGQGEELLAILCHLDVVPAEDLPEWSNDPFDMVEKDGNLYGRGTQDDKGPSVAALYAVKALMDQGIEFDKRVRFIFGTDEETLWRCMARYGEIEEEATYGFAPDSSFPLTYAEKGLLQAYLVGPGSKDLAITNDRAFNAVPAKANYQGNQEDALKQILDKLGFEYTEEDGQVVVLGKSVHAKDAFDGVNAVARLAIALQELFPEEAVLNLIKDKFNQDALAKVIFGEISDEMSGPLTVNLAKLLVNDQESKIGLDIRIPVTADKDDLVAKLSEVAGEYGFTYQEFDYLNSLYVPLDSPLVESLLAVYRDLTGDMTEPISSGGATFARTMPNCVAFGAQTKGADVTEHQIDEHMSVDNFNEAMEIYAHAVKKLAGK